MRSALTYVSALALAAGMTATPLTAAEAEGESQAQGESQVQGQSQAQSGAEAQGEAQAEQPDRLVATVGDEEIRQSDVVIAIEGLPANVQQTPPQMLLPAVVDQLVMRHLILEEARAENLQDDPEVKQMADAGSEDAMEQALVEVWLKRELGERVTDADVEKAVEELKAENPDMGETPDLAPEVRQALQVQAMTDISDELRQGAEITFYGPTGEPVEPTEQVGIGTEGEAGTGQGQGTATEQQN